MTVIEKKEAQPKPGDISVCFYCGQICQFKDDLTLGVIATDDLIELAKKREIDIIKILSAVRFIRERNIRQN